MQNNVNLYYFSPTGGTKKVADIFCKELEQTIFHVNLGEKREAAVTPTGDVIVATPVFGGRIPSVVTDKLRKLNGEGKKAVEIVVYGNRDFDDALLELKNTLEERGFEVIGAGAFVAQHSLAPEVGKGRPDDADKQQIREFSKEVLENTRKGITSKIEVPGNVPYKPEMNMPVTPISLESCNQCGKCKDVCPPVAICLEDGTISTNAEKCILCMACAAACPNHARILPPPVAKQLEEMLDSRKSVRGENKYYV